MKVLIATDSFPFPPLNGKELPIARLFENICTRHDVDLLILSDDNNAKPFIPRQGINLIGCLQVKKASERKKIFTSIITLKHSISPYEYSIEKVKEVIGGRQYDFIWLSPVSYYSFIGFCKQHRLTFFGKTAFGLNDSKTYQYRDSINEFLQSGVFKLRYITVWLRSFLLKKEETRFLRLADLVHVQTNDEAEKVKKFLSPDSKTKIVAVPNGIKEELLSCTYKGIDSNLILYMTHLSGDRLKESEWFIKKVWNLIKEQLPDAKLLIVGKPPKKNVAYINDKSIVVNGYANDLTEVFNNVRFTVVPTFHGTGLINRILDALTAGIPVISTPQAIATFKNIKVEEQIIAAGDTASFAGRVMELYNDKFLRIKIANNGRAYALQCATWKESAAKIEKAMCEILNS